jgi:uncharacterized membrane protein YeaQ/YmgE (transglycosylase-associated protein family)
MNLVLVGMWVLLGLLAGLLAGFVMKRGGFGQRWDLILGLVGSIAASWIFWVLAISPEPEVVATTVVAFAGAALLIVAQRMMWPTVA